MHTYWMEYKKNAKLSLSEYYKNIFEAKNKKGEFFVSQ